MSAILEAENISKIYQSKSGNVTALKNINLKIERGLCYAVIGKSGSGKSTLLHVLGGLDMPDEGAVYYQGKNIFEYNDEKLAIFRRRHMGFVFQQYNLIEEYTVKENICMPIKLDGKKVDRQFYQEIINLLHLQEKETKYPSELSGGEQQRVAIARSLIAKPQMVFADEPSGNLDKKTGEETLELLFNSAKQFGQTLIIVTHDLDIARKAEQIIMIEDGCITSPDSNYINN